MITSFFENRSSATASKVGNGLYPPSKKKQDNKKRNKEYGYCAANISKVIEKIKDSEAGKWRIFNKLKVSYTIITRDWEYGDKKYRECLLAPFGMVSTLLSLHSNTRSTVWNTLREEVKVFVYTFYPYCLRVLYKQ